MNVYFEGLLFALLVYFVVALFVVLHESLVNPFK